MKKKILSLILAGLLLTPALLSCSDNNDQKESETESAAAVSGSVVEETEITYLDDVPDTAKFGGQNIRYVTAADTESVYVDIEDDANITDIVVEGVWRRNNIVQDRLDVRIVFTESYGHDDFNAAVMNSINASSDDYDVFVGHQRFQVGLASQGVMKNLSNMEYLDLTKPYWAGDYIENLSYKGISYWITGDMLNNFIGQAWVIFSNQTMWEMSYPDQDLYDIVRDGRWTVDKLNELTQNQYADENGNGKADSDDRYGLYLEPGIRVTGMMFSSDVPFSAKDADGVPYICVQNEHTYSAFEKIRNLMYNNENVRNTGIDGDTLLVKFATDKIMFFVDKLKSVISDTVRNMESDYKIVPLPKYDEQQENYITTHYDGIPVIGIPITADPDNVDAIAATLEVTSSVSHEISLPAYYDGALKNKYSRDPDQAEMIDLIHDTITGDFAHIYGDEVGHSSSNSLYSYWGDNIKRDFIASVFQKNINTWESRLGELLDAFEDNVDN